MFLLQFVDYRQHAPQLFLRRGRIPAVFRLCGRSCRALLLCRTSVDFRPWTRGLSTNVQDVGSFFQQPLGMRHGLVGIQKLPAVGKRIRGDIHDAHDERALAEFQRPRTQIPLKNGSHAARF
jgi:hypothetical protein